MVNANFAKWAVGFSGCDGGNVKGKIWLCGIEFGGRFPTEEFEFPDVAVPQYVGTADYTCEEFLKHQYNWKAVKLLAALAGRDHVNYTDFFREQSCFQRDSNYFKLNLFPIAFKDTSHRHWRRTNRRDVEGRD